MRAGFNSIATMAATFTIGVAVSLGVAEEVDFRGSWHPESYFLKDGSSYKVDGLIFFAEKDWTVLFFVMDQDMNPQRGSGEGGTYSLDGDRLTFTHRYHLSAGNRLGSLPDSPLRMEVRGASDAPSEPCRVELEGHRMTILFPSGNRMTFRRSSALSVEPD